MNLRELYNSFLESKELYELVPNAHGEWEKDMHDFKKCYIEVNNVFIEQDDEDDEDDE